MHLRGGAKCHTRVPLLYRYVWGEALPREGVSYSPRKSLRKASSTVFTPTRRML